MRVKWDRTLPAPRDASRREWNVSALDGSLIFNTSSSMASDAMADSQSDSWTSDVVMGLLEDKFERLERGVVASGGRAATASSPSRERRRGARRSSRCSTRSSALVVGRVAYLRLVLRFTRGMRAPALGRQRAPAPVWLWAQPLAWLVSPGAIEQAATVAGPPREAASAAPQPLGLVADID